MAISRLFISAFILLNVACHGQKPATDGLVDNPKFNKKLSTMLTFNVPIIGVKELVKNQKNYILLDAREKEEFDIAHIKGAKNIGYDKFDKESVKFIPKDSKIVVYCSVGYRSEKIGAKLIKMGYTNVSNLYGSIFEWANQGNPIYDANEKVSHRIHTYNKDWSKWVDNCKCEKVW